MTFLCFPHFTFLFIKKKTGSNTLKLFFKVLKPAFIYNLEAICPAAYTPLAKG